MGGKRSIGLLPVIAGSMGIAFKGFIHPQRKQSMRNGNGVKRVDKSGVCGKRAGGKQEAGNKIHGIRKPGIVSKTSTMIVLKISTYKYTL